MLASWDPISVTERSTCNFPLEERPNIAFVDDYPLTRVKNLVRTAHYWIRIPELHTTYLLNLSISVNLPPVGGLVRGFLGLVETKPHKKGEGKIVTLTSKFCTFNRNDYACD